jgi:hypothetical protein
MKSVKGGRVDFRVQEVSFKEADRRYAELTRQRDAGSISDQEFDTQRQQLMVRGDEGRWWAKIGRSGEWHQRDGSTWVRGTPPGYQEAIPKPTIGDSPSQTSSFSPPKDVENGKNGRRKMSPWIPVAGLGGVALVGIVLIVWVLVPYLRGEPASDKQGETMSVKQNKSAPADGAAFDSTFIHRATPENILENSTYLDNSLANDDPNVVLYVTQNWNPGGGAGIYDEHPIGVWYDDSRQRWAIFNQDREPMPDGAAFNVAVLAAR